MLPEVREVVQNMVFSNIKDITETEMAAINFGIHKTVVVELHQDLEDGVFYEKRSDMKFFVHRLDDENEHFHTLVCFQVLHIMLHSCDDVS